MQASRPRVPIHGWLSLGAKLPQQRLDVRLDQLALANALTGLEMVATVPHSTRSVHTRAGKAKLDFCREWAGIVNLRQLILRSRTSLCLVCSLFALSRPVLLRHGIDLMKSHHAEGA